MKSTRLLTSSIFALTLFLTFHVWATDTQSLKNKRMDFQGQSRLTIRSTQEVAKRSLALLAMVSRTHEKNPEKLFKWVKSNNIDEYFYPREKSIFFQEKLSFKEKVEFSWRAEALVSLFWSLTIIDKYPNLKDPIDIFKFNGVIKLIENPKNFISKAKLRPKQEIENKEAFLYHQHWRVRDAQIFKKEMPEELNPDIVYERRYGLSWIVGWGDSWDNVPTDT